MRFAFNMPGIGRGVINTEQDNSDSWYVDSNGNAGSGKTPRAPVATLDEANNLASVGDSIYVAEGHTEDITLATEWVLDVVGVKYFGLGRGARRPTITFDETTGNIPISAAGVELHNFLFTISGTKDVVTGITVTGDDVLLKDIEMRQPTTTDEFVDAITLTGCDRIRIENFVYDGATQGGAGQTAIHITDAVSRPVFINHWIAGDFATGAIQNEGAAMVDVFFKDLTIQNIHATAACLTVHANTTGVLDGARFRVGTDNQAVFLAALTVSNKLQVYDLRIVNADGEVGAPGIITDLAITDDMASENSWGTYSVAED